MKNHRYILREGTHTKVVQRKYKSEIGESMGMPNKKLKKLIFTAGITFGVYAVFRYLLPLVIPFFIALGLAALLKPWVDRIRKKLSISLMGRKFQLPAGLVGGVLLLALGCLLGIGLYLGISKLLKEARLLLEDLPRLIREADGILTGWCRRSEEVLRLPEGQMTELLRDGFRNLGSYTASWIMPFLMGSSREWLQAAAKFFVFLVVVYFGTVLALQEGDQIRAYFRKSVFCREYQEMGRILKVVGAAYGKTQIILLAATTAICMAGLFFLGNPYYGLLGLLIGLLDALPFIGTGTVLFPWALICFFNGQAGKGLGLLAIYLASYLLRQVTEAKMMGKQAGLSPFLTLAAVYVGLQLFGILGVVLGPLGFLVIRESVET